MSKAEIRRDMFAELEPKSKRGVSSYYGNRVVSYYGSRGRSGKRAALSKMSFGGPVNDTYGPHAVFGAPAEDAFKNSDIT